MDPLTRQNLSATGGIAPDGEYIDNIFSGRVYVGNGGNNIINNGIDLAGEGGMTWVKYRNTSGDHQHVNDSVRGVTNTLFLDQMDANSVKSDRVNQYDSGGFRLGSNYRVNGNGGKFFSATFRKQPKFFDIVTWTGTGTDKNVAHNLGTTPGMIWVKCTSDVAEWCVYHRSLGATKYVYMDNGGINTSGGVWANTEPTSTQFTVRDNIRVNGSGRTYVAYLFAHNDGDADFGYAGNQDVIKCGDYTIAGGAATTINLGFEPSFVIVRKKNSGSNWWVFNADRGFGPYYFRWMYANTSGAEEYKTYKGVYPIATGFVHDGSNNGQWGNADYIYMAIRRSDGYVGKPATTSSEVFWKGYGSSSGVPLYRNTEFGPGTNGAGAGADMVLQGFPSSSTNKYIGPRLGGEYHVYPNLNNTKNQNSNSHWDYSNGWNAYSSGDTSGFSYLFRRHKGFDTLNYKGNNSNGHVINHTMNSVPEMIWCKDTEWTQDWVVYHKDMDASNPLNYTLKLNSTDGRANNTNMVTAVSKTSFTIGNNGVINSANDYYAFLFSSVDGISKCGGYTGTGASGNTVTLGFQPTFVLIRSVAYGSFIAFDTLRGWAAGNDKSFPFTNAGPQYDMDFGAPTSTGFTISGTHADINASGVNYIYYAHA